MPSDRPKSVGSFIVTAILQGRADNRLGQIVQACSTRQRTLAQELLGELEVGDKVQFNDRVKPKYLRGLEGEVKSIEGDKVQIDMGIPIRKYGRIILAPGTIIEKVA